MSTASHSPPTSARCRDSLERSRSRRAAASRRRRRRLRARTALVAGTVAMTALSGVALAASGGSSAPASQGRSTELSQGSSGSAVSALQRALGIAVTGRFDSATAAAVRRFQRAHGLSVDGVAGPQTLSALGLSRLGRAARYSRRSARGLNAELARIAACESGGDPQAVSPDGRYRGKYQFDLATWHQLGGTGDPAQAPESEQDQIARALLRRRGTAPWPNCG